MELQIFSNSEFGEIRSVEKENKGTVIDGGKIVGFVSTTELKGEK